MKETCSIKPYIGILMALLTLLSLKGSSTIITSQLPVLQWHEIIGENTIADAILDRIVHQAHRIELSGESMRKQINKTNISLGETD